MNALQQRTRSPWMSQPGNDFHRPSLTGHLTADAVIVGGGMAGLSVAYELGRAGQNVVVLDAGTVAGGMSARTTAHISDALDDWWFLLAERRGAEDARTAASSYRRAIGRIEEIVATEGMDCDFRRCDGFLFPGEGCEPSKLDRELATCRAIGLEDVERLDAPPGIVSASGPALRFPGQARFHPLGYLGGLVRAVEAVGGRIHGDSRVVKIQGGTRAGVETGTGVRVSAGAVIVATNTPVNDRVAVHTKQAPYRTYAIALELRDLTLPDALYWDTAEPYHYVRLLPGDDADHVIVGGEDHKAGQADDGQARLARLEAWARRHIPGLGGVQHRWSGQVMEPVDGLAFIGRNPMDDPNVYVATGDSGMGITHGAIAGMLISDLVLGRANPWEKVFAPNRITSSTIGPYIGENLNVLAQLKDYLRPGTIADPDALAAGSGGLMRRGARMVAVYRDSAGVLHELSAICPMLGASCIGTALRGAGIAPVMARSSAVKVRSSMDQPAPTWLILLTHGDLRRRPGGKDRSMKPSTWKLYGFAWITGCLFLFSLLGHWVLGWFAFVSEQSAHNQPVIFSDFLVQVGRDTLENWQSEFLQLLWQVAGLAFLLYVGSPQSKEGDERKEAKIDALLRRTAPDEAEQLIASIDRQFPRR